MIEIQLDGTLISTEENKTLLEIATENGVHIPSLCNIGSRLNTEFEHHCNICVVEVCLAGSAPSERQCLRACETLAQQGMEVVTHSAFLSEQRQQALKYLLQDHFADCEAPCQQACPAGVDVQQYLYHLAQGNHTEAVKVIKQTLPMPLSIGRVCPAFCEAECRRSLIDEPVAIRQLKRHAADLDLADMESYVPERLPDTGKKVAIIGAGPAGLTAGYFLSNQGHNVTIYDEAPQAGGWLRYGIPEYRLPKAILDKEIELLQCNGLEIVTGCRLGRDIHLDELAQTHDAICLAIGAQKAVEMNYPGSDLAGCFLGVDYLRDYCTDKRLTTGNKVAVIGGGNTAIDCARTAVREGADVTLIYRRTKASMPAEPHEVHAAEEEGVKFHFLANPACNHADDHGWVRAVTFDKMLLSEPDASGRQSVIASGEQFTEDFDTVIAAVSQQTDLSFLDTPKNQLASGQLTLTRWNTISGCDHTMSAGIDKLFVIGDSRRGPATAVAAIADGRRAAEAISRQLSSGLTCALSPRAFNARKATKTRMLDKSLYPASKVEPRVKMAELPAAERLQSFAEVELGFSQEQALREAARCLECACQSNKDCKLRHYATEYKIKETQLDISHARRFVIDDSAPLITFDANRCISCGACISTCHSHGHNVIRFTPDHYSALPAGEEALRCAPRAGFSVSMADSECVQCGQCVQVCPTGALVYKTDKRYNRVTMRALGLYRDDLLSDVRVSHGNPGVIAFYRDMNTTPMGALAHQLLHTHYIDRTRLGA